MERPRGVVTFVGLGPGDPTLRTERAVQRLADADHVIDADHAPVARMVELARQGQHVVRVVVGDPLESARCLSEMLQVAGEGVDLEVVPAVGATAAAGAFAGVTGQALMTSAHEVAGVLAATPGIAPVTLVANPSLSSQRVHVTTAVGAADLARSMGQTRVLVAFGAPHEALRWFERRPLFGRRVLVTRAREQAGSLAALLRDEGADVVVVPTIEIRDPLDPGPLSLAVADLRAGAYGWVVFTSANGVEKTWNAVAASGADARAFGSSKLAAIGPATARALESHGLRADLIAKEFVGESLAQEMLEALQGSPSVEDPNSAHVSPSAPRILLPRAAKARDVVPEALRAVGCRVDVVAAYETHAPPADTVEFLIRELEEGRLDIATFTSSSTVDHFCELLGSRAPELLSRVRVAVIGPITAETARVRGIRVDLQAREFSVPGLVACLLG